jgi:hypothetical protein
MSSELFGSISRALLNLQHKSACKISFRRLDLFPGLYCVVIAGTTDQIREAEQAIQTLAESSAVPAELDLFSIPPEVLSD